MGADNITATHLVNVIEDAIANEEPVERAFNQEEIEFMLSQAERVEYLERMRERDARTIQDQSRKISGLGGY